MGLHVNCLLFLVNFNKHMNLLTLLNIIFENSMKTRTVVRELLQEYREIDKHTANVMGACQSSERA
jgi:hypothetical protein